MEEKKKTKKKEREKKKLNLIMLTGEVVPVKDASIITFLLERC